jgi:hypothetical protein
VIVRRGGALGVCSAGEITKVSQVRSLHHRSGGVPVACPAVFLSL